jgi:MFS family permease
MQSDVPVKNKIMPWFICLIAALFYFYEFLLRVAPSVMIEDFRRVFLLNGGEIGLLLSFYYWAYTPMQLPGGPILDYYGPRKVLLVSVIACCIGSYLIAYITNLHVAQFSLFLMGWGSAFSFVGVLKLATNWLPNKYFSLISGLTTALGMVGAIFGQAFMHNIIATHGWQYAWKLGGAMGIVLLILTLIFVHDCPRSKAKQEPIRHHINIFQPFKELWSLMKSCPQFLLNGVMGGFLFAPVSVFASSWGVMFLRYVFGYSDTVASMAVPYVFIGMGVGAPLIGWLYAYAGRDKLLLQLSALILTVLTIILIFHPHLSLFNVKCLLFFIGLAVGPQILVFQRSVLLASANLGGTATAGTNFIVMIPAMVYSALIGYILDYASTMRSGMLQHFSARDFQWAMAIIPLSLLLALILSFFMKNLHKPKRGEERA